MLKNVNNGEVHLCAKTGLVVTVCYPLRHEGYLLVLSYHPFNVYLGEIFETHQRYAKLITVQVQWYTYKSYI